LKKRWRACRRAAWLRNLGADGLTGFLEVLHRHLNLAQAVGRFLDTHRQRCPHRGHLVAERAALGFGPHGDRHHRLQHEVLGVVPLSPQVAAEGQRHGGQDDVVERAAE